MKEMSFEQMLNKPVKPVKRMYETVILKIDGEPVVCNIMGIDEFVKTFHELETLMYADDRSYWVLYEEYAPETEAYQEIFWCIPTHEIDFIWDMKKGWHIASGVGVTKVDSVTLDKEEEFEFVEDEYSKALNTYTEFMSNLGHYLLFNHKADADNFKVFKAIQEWTDTPIDTDICADNKVCLVTYLETYWNAWFQSILNREYKYMNFTHIVWESWLEN